MRAITTMIAMLNGVAAWNGVATTLPTAPRRAASTAMLLDAPDPGLLAGNAGMLAGAAGTYLLLSGVFQSAGVFKPASASPSYRELKYADALQNFGWLKADLRMPLPDLAELQGACHRIGTMHENGHTLYLCADKSPGCQQSRDFSDHYKQPVYICDECSFT